MIQVFWFHSLNTKNKCQISGEFWKSSLVSSILIHLFVPSLCEIMLLFIGILSRLCSFLMFVYKGSCLGKKVLKFKKSQTFIYYFTTFLPRPVLIKQSFNSAESKILSWSRTLRISSISFDSPGSFLSSNRVENVGGMWINQKSEWKWDHASFHWYFIKALFVSATRRLCLFRVLGMKSFILF